VVVVHHTDCGMLTFTDDQLRQKVRDELGAESDTAFLSFTDLDQSVRDDVAAIRASRVLLKDVPVTGFAYDVKTGRLRQVA
jgi:carbonic anhydrase